MGGFSTLEHWFTCTNSGTCTEKAYRHLRESTTVVSFRKIKDQRPEIIFYKILCRRYLTKRAQEVRLLDTLTGFTKKVRNEDEESTRSTQFEILIVGSSFCHRYLTAA